MNAEKTTQYLTLPEAAEFLGLKKSYVYKLIHLRQIPYCKYGARLVRFNAEALQEWKEARLQEIPTATQMRERAEQYCMAHPRK